MTGINPAHLVDELFRATNTIIPRNLHLSCGVTNNDMLASQGQ